MKTIFTKNMSFCDGVQRAFDLVDDFVLKNNKKSGRIFILGALVHNESVSERINRMGIRKIKNLRPVGDGDKVIITAHGSSKAIFDKIASRNAEAFDTTCPKVAKVQRIARHYSAKGYKVLIFGDAKHKEVRGINGWTGGKSVIFENLHHARIAAANFSDGFETRAVLLSQTTQDIRQYKEISSFFKGAYKNIIVFDTICRATFLRQKETNKISKDTKKMVVVIGGKDSGNTKRLWQICKRNNPNTIWISSLKKPERKELAKAAKKFKMAVIVSGASTPRWQIDEVDNYLRNC